MTCSKGHTENPIVCCSPRNTDVVEVYSDAGISGAKGRNGRPGLDSMLKDASRRKFDIVMAWAIDRLGRSLSDLLDTIQRLEAGDVDLYLDQQAMDTTTPMGKLVFQLTGAFAEFERTMIRQRIKAGLKRAIAQGVKLGRPKIDSATERKVRKRLAKGIGILRVASCSGSGVTASWDNTARIWDAHLQAMAVKDLIAEACVHLAGVTKLTREEMRLARYPDSMSEIDVCTSGQ